VLNLPLSETCSAVSARRAVLLQICDVWGMFWIP